MPPLCEMRGLCPFPPQIKSPLHFCCSGGGFLNVGSAVIGQLKPYITPCVIHGDCRGGACGGDYPPVFARLTGM